MTYQLKPCREEDREWAYALKSEAYRQVVERQFGPWDESFQSELFRSRWIPNISNLIFVDGALVGLMALEERRDEFWLDEIQLVREWRGRGIGSAIIRDIVVRARKDRKMLRLQVLKENSRACPLSQAGFLRHRPNRDALCHGEPRGFRAAERRAEPDTRANGPERPWLILNVSQ